MARALSEAMSSAVFYGVCAMSPEPTFQRDGNRWVMPPIPARDNCGLGDPYLTADGLATDMIIPRHLRDDDSMLAPGALAVLADSAIGFAIITRIERPTGMATSHLHLDILRPFVATDTSVLCCTGRLVHDDGNHYALGQGTVVDDTGRVVATATVGAVLIPPRMIRPPENDGQAANEVVTAQDWTSIHHFLGSESAAPDSGATTTFTSTPRLANKSGGLHGGIGVLMGERAMQRALDGSGPHQFTLVELHATYPRPIAATGGEVECRATVTYRGRQLATVRGELLDQRGKVAVVVDGTYIATGYASDTNVTLRSDDRTIAEGDRRAAD